MIQLRGRDRQREHDLGDSDADLRVFGDHYSARFRDWCCDCHRLGPAHQRSLAFVLRVSIRQRRRRFSLATAARDRLRRGRADATFCPLAGLAWLTLVLATFLMIEAALEFVLYFNIRHRARSGWVLVDAIITLLLGILIWAHWPVSSGWAIGTLIGVSLIFSGISRLMLSSATSRAPATA